jgi:branched-chain amino acid aminotransferase
MVQTLSPVATISQRRERRRPGALGHWAFFEGEFVPLEQAKIGVATHAFNYGTACFGGIRGYWNERREQLYVFRLDRHFNRFLDSCKLLNIVLPYDVPALSEIVLELLRREKYRTDAYIRPLAYKATEDITPRLHDLDDEFTCFTRPLGDYIKLEVRVCVSSWRRIDDNSIPARGKITGAYVNSAFSRSEAYWNGYDEAIALNQDGHVSEGSAENLFLVRHGMLITPPRSENILEGITRATLMLLAEKELGVPVAERAIDRSELYVAEEAFFCGTGAQVSAIVEIDHRPIGDGHPGPLTKKLQELYFNIVRGNNPKYRDWLTPVYPE